jgi:UDP-GlcNAc:undecaprenyl-phosphate GlcNAc-1-phosphate transferase
LGTFLDGYEAPLVAAGLSLVATLFLTPFVKKLAIKKGAIDDPKKDDRRIHKEPIPRWGGLAIFGGIVIALAAVIPFAYPVNPFPPYLIGLLVVATILVGLGALDDVKHFSAKIQAGYILAGGFIIQLFSPELQMQGMSPMFGIGGDTWIDFGWLAWPITAIYYFVITKTMDTIDGVDGLASGIAAISSAALAIIAVMEGQPRVALVAAAIAGSCVGFLKFNYNPAKIFMATGGSQMLGFTLAAISIVGAFKTAAALALLIPMLVFAVPLFDAVFVVLRRLKSGEPITQGDKRHVHHTLLSFGLNQRQTVWVLYIVTGITCGVLVWMVGRS